MTFNVVTISYYKITIFPCRKGANLKQISCPLYNVYTIGVDFIPTYTF